MAAEDNTASTTDATGQAPYELTQEKMLTDNLLIIGLIFFIFYFILIRPQQKRLKAHQNMMKTLQKGNKIMTTGGIIGSIIKFEGEDVVVLEIAPNVRIRASRNSVSEVLSDTLGVGETANDN
jgi:preprotein translocase subunit YajC